MFEETAFGEDFVGAPAFEFGDGFVFLDEGTLITDGFGFESEFFAFKETGDEFGDEFGWWGTAGEDVVDFDEFIDGVDFFEQGGNNFVRDNLLGVDRGFGVDIDFFQDFVLGMQVR